jgi:glycosyltransferase involved in cell wall biosynthesis
MSMKIAVTITDLDVGGAERCLVDLLTRLDRNRFEPVVFCLAPRPESDEASCVPALEAAGIEVHCLNARRLWHAPSVIRRLTRLLAGGRFQLLQTFLFHGNLVGRIAARRARIPRVVSGIRVAEQSARWHLWADRLTARMADRHVCVSQSVARFAARQSGLPAEKLLVIPNGIDTTAYGEGSTVRKADLAAFGVPPARRAITFIGRLTPQKGVEWLLETAPGWIDRLPDCDLLLVGKGPLRPRLERLAEDLRIRHRVHFAGWQSNVAGILAASHLLVLPSRWEGMPNVVLQAMASRLPVLATDVEGVRELLGPSADAQTAAYGASETFVGKLLGIMSNPPYAAKLGRKNRIQAETHFSLASMVEAYQRLWESL